MLRLCPVCHGERRVPVLVGPSWAGRSPFDNPLPEYRDQPCEECEGWGEVEAEEP